MANMFDKAKKTSPVKKSTAKKDDKERVEIEGMEQLAAIDAVIKSLQAARGAVEADVKSAMVDHFVAKGMEHKKKPDNFRGVEGNAEGSCEMRKRSTASALSEDEQKTLADHGIATEEKVSVEEAFVINPAYKDDQDLLARVSEALEGVDGIPEDFIQLQEKQSTRVVSKAAMDQIFQQGDENTVRTLLDIVGVLAVKPGMKKNNLAEAMKQVADLIDMEEE